MAETDPTWDEATSASGAAEPAELVRPPVTLVVDVRCDDDGTWIATCPKVTGLKMCGSTREWAEANARANLESWIGSHVTLEFRQV